MLHEFGARELACIADRVSWDMFAKFVSSAILYLFRAATRAH